MSRKSVKQIDVINDVNEIDENEPMINQVEEIDEETSDEEVEQVHSVQANESKNEVDMSIEDIEKLGLKNTSETIRYLHAQGYKVAPISRFLNKRYQHVRNVIMTPLKKRAE